MRMWGVDPSIMCNKHLLGEHVEMHMFLGCYIKGKSLDSYILKGLVEIDKLRSRHEDLVKEMRIRGMNHNSPFNQYIFLEERGRVNVANNLEDLLDRCRDCRRKYYESSR